MFYTYILANRPKGTLYIGHTDDLPARLAEHEAGEVESLISKHKPCQTLMWFETHPTRTSAYERQEQMKGWNRSSVIKRIRHLNSKWDDLGANLDAAALANSARAFPSDTDLPAAKAAGRAQN